MLASAGMDAYPIHTNLDFELEEVIKSFAKLAKTKTKKYSLVGRIMSLRPQGGLIFFHFSDGTGTFQALLKKGEKIKDEDFDLFHDTVDIGDFVEVSGTLFTTKREEKTVQVLLGECSQSPSVHFLRSGTA